MGKYRDAIVAGAEGRAAGTLRINIEVQSLIDEASARGASELRGFDSRGSGCLLLFAGLAAVFLLGTRAA